MSFSWLHKLPCIVLMAVIVSLNVPVLAHDDQIGPVITPVVLEICGNVPGNQQTNTVPLNVLQTVNTLPAAVSAPLIPLANVVTNVAPVSTVSLVPIVPVNILPNLPPVIEPKIEPGHYYGQNLLNSMTSNLPNNSVNIGGLPINNLGHAGNNGYASSSPVGAHGIGIGEILPNSVQIPAVGGESPASLGAVGGQRFVPFNLNIVSQYSGLLNSRTDIAGRTAAYRAERSRERVIMFTSANQVLTGINGRRIRGTEGTTIATGGSDLIILHKGHILAESGKASTVIKTRKCSVSLEAAASAIVEAQEGRAVRILAIAGGGRAPVSIVSNDSQQEAIALQPGQELVLGDEDLAEEEMIPAEGPTQIAVAGSIEKRCGRHVRTITNRDDVSESDFLPAGHSVRLGGAGHRFVDASKAAISGSPDAGLLFHLQAMSAQNPDAGHKRAESCSRRPLEVLAAEGTQLSQSESGSVYLHSGSVLVVPPDNTRIETAAGFVDVTRSGVAFIECSSGQLRVKALSGPSDVSVSCCGHTIKLIPGEEVLIADHNLGPQEVIPADGIGRRTRVAYPVAGKLAVVISDFSIPMLLGRPAYRASLHAADRDGRLYEGLLKTAVCVELVERGRGAYSVNNPSPELLSSADR